MELLLGGYERWGILLGLYPELENMENAEMFSQWIEEHPGLINPTTDKPFSEEDWVDHNAYYKYLQLVGNKHENKNEAHTEQHKENHSEQSHHQDEHYHPVYIEENDPRIQAPVIPLISIPTPSHSYSATPEPLLGGNSGSGGSNGSGGPPPRRRRIPGMNGSNGLKNLASTGRNAIQAGQKLASVGGFLAANIVPISIVVLLLLLLVLIFAMSGDGEDSESTIPVTINKSGPTEVANGAEITYTINASYPGTADDICRAPARPRAHAQKSRARGYPEDAGRAARCPRHLAP